MGTPIKLGKEELRGTDRSSWNKPPDGSSKKEQPAAAGEILEWNHDMNPPSVRDDNGWRTATNEEIRTHGAGGYPSPIVPTWNEQLEQIRSRLVQSTEEQTVEVVPPKDMPKIEETGPTTFEEAFDAVIADLRLVIMARQRKYGKKNIQKHRDFGVAVRISDKEARIHNAYFLPNGQPRPKPLDSMSDESLDDTFADTANYAIIALMVRNGTFDLPLKEDK